MKSLSSLERRSLEELFPWAFSEGVVAMGIAERMTAGTLQEELTLKVYVEKKLPESRCTLVIPKTVQIEGLPPIETDVETIGKIELHSFVSRVRPAVPGFSIGRALDKGVAGTLGLLVRKRGKANSFYVLSNSHAIADSGRASKGDAIVQPGGADGGKASTDTIGSLEKWIPFQFTDSGYPNLVDCAIAQVDPKIVTAAIAQIGAPSGSSTALTRGMEVQKVGRTSTYSVARVKDIHLRIPATYPTASGALGRVGFQDQVLTSFYTTGGDSGSAVLNMDNEVVGLHFAGSEMVGIFNKIENVLNALDIEVVTDRTSREKPNNGDPRAQ